ncbi:TrsD [Halobacillus amylolyticus]|uniref:TrsD n=1 Tax=Halobacillus amylolyticus TaxID=2932259 RepID=A0ABY4HH50_9BACI|nr:TrsD [Halobacillus amylolyticus]UOR14084.1 TrsD [Halobacillus amylolyticus]
MSRELFTDRKERLRQEGKVELPMNIDSKKYLIGSLAFLDLLILAPAVMLSVAIVIVYYVMTGSVNQVIIIISLTPTMIMLILQVSKHPERKNISLLQYKLLWRMNYKRRVKDFYYSKGAMTMATTKEGAGDTRVKIPVKNIANGCIETKDNRLVKIIEVSSINLSLMNEIDQDDVLVSYQNFINELEEKQIQVEQIAQPINLASYSAWIKETGREDRATLRKVKEAYMEQIEDIQKNKSMVTRKRYVSISVPNKANAYDTIEMKANHIQFKLENMLSGYEKLTANILKNDDLIRLIYTCIDFENAQSQGEGIVKKAKSQSPVVVGKDTSKELDELVRKRASETFK